MKQKAKKWGLFALRWGIAALGIWYVVTNISWRDRAWVVLDERNVPVEVRLAEPAHDIASTVAILDPVSGEVRHVQKSQLVNEPDRTTVEVRPGEGPAVTASLLATDLTPDLERAERLLIADPASPTETRGLWIEPSQVVGGYQVRVPFPLVQGGLGHMLQGADRLLLWGAVLIFPITFVITGLRWHLLLTALGINLGIARAFVINMVGAFYNTFMPGSTGGDLLKAYYAAKQAPDRRTRAVISVIIDRAIGLLALVIMGGIAAASQWEEPACRQVALGAAVIMVMTAVGLVVFYVPSLRRASGLDFVLRKLPMQRQVAKAVDAMEVYRRRPGLVLTTLVITFPVHITVVLSAMLAGMAFDLPLKPQYYFVVVPVVVLAGAIPISPQGAGVMEFFAIILTRREGATVAQAFALTMSIRLVQILWNLVGGIFVFRGGYQAPTEKEQEAFESDADDAIAPAAEPPSSSAPPVTPREAHDDEQPTGAGLAPASPPAP